MDTTPARSRLRYVDAGDLDDTTIDFDGLKVRNAAGETLGEVDGAIVDADEGRPYYIVVDAGGWFHSRRYLVPIGHLRLDHDNDALVADLSREQINRFPGFDVDEFGKLSREDLQRLDGQLTAACCPAEVADVRAVGDRSHYRTPDWWSAAYAPPLTPGAGTAAVGDRQKRPRGGEPDRVARAEAVVAREGGESSPHQGGRAEPGDVIGVETGGERTYLGDTKQDEDKRRRAAEKGAGKQADADLGRAKRD